MIFLLLACFAGGASVRDQQFCEQHCLDAGAAKFRKVAWYLDPTATKTEVAAGDILCTCYFPKGYSTLP